MQFLLDTHILLWYLDNNPKLPDNWKRSIENRHNRITVSIASLWEIAILPIRPTHLVQLLSLPFHHRDPFDRLIIAQAQVEHMTVISIDALFARYPVTTLSLDC